jgi:FKBP-type peptidyl-prolyl cis-trans isomerase FkpA
MRIKNLFVIALFIPFAYSCNKSEKEPCTTVMGSPSAVEIANVQNFISSSSITATFDTRGFYYNIVNAGTGTESPTLASTITIKYRGSLTNGTVFDQTAAGATATFPLNNLILGWQLGVPLIKKGGIINLYLPPALGYGCAAIGSIPSNSILIFQVELVDF